MGKQRPASAWTFKSCRFRFEVRSWGLQGLQAGSPECHFHRHEGSQFTIFFSSLPSFPFNWPPLEAQESLSTWNRISVLRNVVLGTFWAETGYNPKLHVLLCGLYLCFLWNELRHSSSFQIAAKAKWPHCPWAEGQHITGKTVQGQSFLKNLLTKTSCFSHCLRHCLNGYDCLDK